MKPIQFTLIALFATMLVSKCANPLRPTGGPKDTIPPNLILSDPLHQTLNFKERTVTLTFDELINADKLKQKLIITPTLKGNYKQLIKKQEIKLEFEEPFQDSTTYTLNFFDGITDITEKNPAENLILAFSTTNYIDSLKICGYVEDHFSKEPIAKMTIGLYSLTDSLDIYSTQPTYFINTDESGNFLVQNMRQDRYMLIGFGDENKNLKFDPETEQYTFSEDTLIPSFTPDTLHLTSTKINAAELKLINGKPAGKHFEIRYSKPITNYLLYIQDTLKTVYHKLQAEKDVIRIYNTFDNINDSTEIIVSAFDSLKNNTVDTLFVKFRESSKKSSELEWSSNPKKGGTLKNTESISLAFNKPILSDALDSIVVHIDSLKIMYPIQDKRYSFDNSIISFTPVKADDLKILIDTILTHRASLTDSINLAYTSFIKETPTQKVKLSIPPYNFISAEGDTSKIIEMEYQYLKPEEFGTIKFNLTTDKESYTLQLIDKKLTPIESIKNCTSCVFSKVAPGDYSLRILIDDNKDGMWDVGNIRQWRLPESVYLHPEFTTLRANWAVEVNVDF